MMKFKTFWYKKARKYIHLYAESQREYKKLNERYLSALKNTEDALEKVYNLTLENAKLKIAINRR